MHQREISPLADKEVTLNNGKLVKVLGWFNNTSNKDVLARHKNIVDLYLKEHPDLTMDDDNILVAVYPNTPDALLVHISDIVGYVREMA